MKRIFRDIQDEIAGDFFCQILMLNSIPRIDHHNKMMNQIYHRATVSLLSERLPTFSGKSLHKPSLPLPDLIQ